MGRQSGAGEVFNIFVEKCAVLSEKDYYTRETAFKVVFILFEVHQCPDSPLKLFPWPATKQKNIKLDFDI